MKEGIDSGKTVKVDRGGGLSHLLQVKPLEVRATSLRVTSFLHNGRIPFFWESFPLLGVECWMSTRICIRTGAGTSPGNGNDQHSVVRR